MHSLLNNKLYESINNSVCFWSWNSDISEHEITKQLSDFAGGRIQGVIIHARAGLKIEYMGKEWFSMFRFAVKEAERLGLEVWIYDENGWPSGFADGKITVLGSEFCLKRMEFSFRREDIPKEVSDDNIIAVYEGEGTSYHRINPKGGEGNLFFWYIADSYYVDLLNPKTTEKFIEFTHEVYKEELGEYFGGTIKGVFTDEPQLNSDGCVWSTFLSGKFEEITGENILDNLWLLAVNGSGYTKFRYDFWKSVGSLYGENFVKQVADWCGNNNLLFTGHYASEDGLCNQIMCSGSLTSNYANMSLPGIDHLGSRIASPVLMKQVSSVSRQFGNANALSETFGCGGWGVSFRQLAWIWGGQSVLGITKPCYHLSAFSLEGRRKRDYPPVFSYQEPWWDQFKWFSSWIENLNLLMTCGERELHTLVIPPVTEIMSEFHDKDRKHIHFISSQFRVLVENLLDLQLDFDIGDEQLLAQNARVENGVISFGKCRYDTVFVSYQNIISKGVAELLEEFSKSGGRVIFINQMPENYETGAKADFDLPNAEVVSNRRNTLEKIILYFGDMRSTVIHYEEDLKTASGLYTHIRKIGDNKRIHIWPKAEFAAQDVIASIDGIRKVYELDIITKEKKELPVLSYYNNKTLVKISLLHKQNVVIDAVSGKADVSFAGAERVKSKLDIIPCKIELSAPNCITLDNASYSVDGGDFSEVMPVLQMLKEIYALKRKKESILNVKYSFICENVSKLKGLTLAAEAINCKSITVNKKTIELNDRGWWVDKSIKTFSIDGLIKDGENEIVLSYDIPAVETGVDVEEVFETEANRFCYEIEPDSIYILGDFDVAALGQVVSRSFCYKAESEGFVLKEPKIKTLGDLTVQNMWFYRGHADYIFDVEKPIKGKTFVVCEEYSGTAIELYINENKAVSFDSAARFDVTPFLRDGRNIATLRLIGHNRNLMGPHHHKNGENFLIGPATYEGKWKILEEFMSPWLWHKKTYTSKYGFIPFGIKKIEVWNTD